MSFGNGGASIGGSVNIGGFKVGGNLNLGAAAGAIKSAVPVVASMIN